jgi:hypothetical protein
MCQVPCSCTKVPCPPGTDMLIEPCKFDEYEDDCQAFLAREGLGDDAPCCGPTCSMDRCLRLIQLQFEVLQEPLEFERIETRDKNGDGDYKRKKDENQGDGACCGVGCSPTGCFQWLLDSIILLQTPIQNTLDNFNRSRPDTMLEEGRKEL